MDKEKQIIQEAKKLFSEIGYKATTMDLLATRANMGKGTLYLYFNSKEDVLKSIVDQLLETINEKATYIENTNANYSEKINMFIKEMITFKNEQKMVAKLVFEAEAIGGQVVLKYIKQLEDSIIENIKIKIDLAIDKHYIKECNSKFKAFLIYKIYMILVLEWEEQSNTKLTESELYNILENLFK